MKLSKLLEGTSAHIIAGNPDCTPTALCCDSRKAVPGSLFVAVKGFSSDGRDFVDDALSRGAICAVESDRSGLAVIADRFFDHPSGKLKLVGITGTNGKTTTVTLLYNLFRKLGYECGMLSTIANYIGSEKDPTDNTTPDSVTINSLLSRMADIGCEYCFMEVSSIGVQQGRIDALEFKAGIFSNLTHDHLDYHKTFAEYLRCKKLFFDRLTPDAYAIVNIDDKNGTVMVQNCSAMLVSYSCTRPADHTCRILEESMEGMLLELDGTQVWTKLTGRHNAYNVLAVYTTALCLGADRDEVLVALSALDPAPGRMETLHGPDEKTVVIDYAHTPDALENILQTLRDVERGRTLVCLFGCGGDRDRSKRPEMAAIAQKYADRIVITSDNPRSEDENEIIHEICTGLSPEGRAKTLCIADRSEAIRAAIALAPKGATILLAGKGHEDYQITAKGKIHFDEREIVRDIFSGK